MRELRIIEESEAAFGLPSETGSGFRDPEREHTDIYVLDLCQVRCPALT